MYSGFDFADVVDEVVARTGGETATAADILKIRRGLRIITERWTAQGFNTWRIKSLAVTVAAGIPEVPIPDKVDDIIVAQSVMSGLGSEAGMRRISASEYAQLTRKTTRGRPSQFWLNRQEKPKLYVFPAGRENADDTIILTYVERPADFERYSNEGLNDIPARWLEALILALATDLARKRPPLNEGLIARLKSEADEAESTAQRTDRDRANYSMRFKVR